MMEQKNNFARFGVAKKDTEARMDYNATLNDDDLESSGGQYRLLPEGVYDFTVYEILKERTKANNDPMVKIELHIHTDDGDSDVIVFDRIVLKDSLRWKMARYFKTLGMFDHVKQHGMDWDGSVDKSGKVEIDHTIHDGKTYNHIKNYVIDGAAAVR